jgi:hypothetical protein
LNEYEWWLQVSESLEKKINEYLQSRNYFLHVLRGVRFGSFGEKLSTKEIKSSDFDGVVIKG